MSGINANPKCRLCGRAMVWIGIGGGAEPACPQDCSACVKCKHPKAEIKHTASKVVSIRTGPGTFVSIFYRTMTCGRCGAMTDVEVPAGQSLTWSTP